jgi:hypothetical protein
MSTALASEFPENPLFVLRAGWPCLMAYYIVAGVIVLLLWRSLHAWRFVHSTKPRIITATVLAAIFAPSEVSDFFLFNIPGPAVAGLFMLFIALAFAAPIGFFEPKIWAMIAGYYLLPLLLFFTVAYLVLWVYARSHRPPIQSA